MVTYTSRNALHKPELADTGFPTHMDANADIIDAAIAKCTYTETADPGVGDDSADGYAKGSIWLNATSDRWFVCEDPAAGAAVWRQIWPPLANNLSIASQARGDLLYMGASAWSRLGKGTAGYFLKQGSDDPAWAEVVAADTNFTATSRLLGRKTASGGDGEEVTLSEALDFVGSAAQGDILYRGSSTWARLGAGTKGQALITSGASANPQYIDYHSDMYRQLLINGGFQVNQHAVTTYTAATVPDNGDDHYLHDQWILLSDGNDIVDVSAETTIVPSGAAASVKFEVETQNKKFGYLQIIENKDAIKYAGQVVSLQFKARTTTGKIIRNIRAAILSWTGTADAVTSDVVSAWGNEGDNPTLAANWTAENVAANNALVADTWTTYKIENISIDTASMANLAVFIWVDDTDAAVDDLLYIGDVQLNVGPVCLPYMPRSFADELHRCMRFYQKSYLYAIAPGTKTQTGNRFSIAASSYTFYDAMVPLLVPMAKTPTVTAYSTETGAANNVYREGVGDVAATTSDQSEVSFLVNLGGSGVVGAVYRVQWVADARL